MRSRGESKTRWIAIVSSTTPRLGPRWPPARECATFSTRKARISAARSVSWASLEVAQVGGTGDLVEQARAAAGWSSSLMSGLSLGGCRDVAGNRRREIRFCRTRASRAGRGKLRPRNASSISPTARRTRNSRAPSRSHIATAPSTDSVGSTSRRLRPSLGDPALAGLDARLHVQRREPSKHHRVTTKPGVRSGSPAGTGRAAS